MARDRIPGLGAFALSRAVVAAAGLAALAIWGANERNARSFDPQGLTDGAGPLARWDSVWFLEIARDGYDRAHDAAFFPLYPLLVRLGGGSVLAGAVLSLACFAAALWLLHRLVALDFGERVARLCVLLVAVFPGAFFFSAVYSESLFLLLSVAAVYGARTGRWELA
ncbi:MAG TPA: mannosyltransferase family protein, partial [Solirubrobacteraceae bacterium]|nr:mannosyltransferase family protein [Solirubrobacteraceae bacterium]